MIVVVLVQVLYSTCKPYKNRTSNVVFQNRELARIMSTTSTCSTCTFTCTWFVVWLQIWSIFWFKKSRVKSPFVCTYKLVPKGVSTGCRWKISFWQFSLFLRQSFSCVNYIGGKLISTSHQYVDWSILFKICFLRLCFYRFVLNSVDFSKRVTFKKINMKKMSDSQKLSPEFLLSSISFS